MFCKIENSPLRLTGDESHAWMVFLSSLRIEFKLPVIEKNEHTFQTTAGKWLRQVWETLGDEASGPLFMKGVMRSNNDMNSLSLSPVYFLGKILFSTNWKSHFLSLMFSQQSDMIKQF